MKFFVTGSGGQLGYDVILELKKRGYKDIVAPTFDELDITDRDKVIEMITLVKPDVIFHCAAYTAVDNAEDNKDICFKVNVDGTKNIVDASKMVDAKIIFMSTDYIFDGEKIGEYTEEDSTNPKNVYGESKVLGEELVRGNPKHFITRISWVFGKNGKNFIKTMLELAKTKTELNVVSDQIGSPTYTVDLAKVLVDMSFSSLYGTYNVTNSGYCSWAEFADEIFKKAGKDVLVNHINSEEYPQKAYRPRNSKLNKEKLKNNFSVLPTWQDAVEKYLKEIEVIK